jgi:hypothetical protein
LSVSDIVWRYAEWFWLSGEIVWLLGDIVWRSGVMFWLFCGLLKTTGNPVSPVDGSKFQKVTVISRIQSTISRARIDS